MVQLDSRNASGSVSRSALFHQVQLVCPALLPYAMACYGGPLTISNAMVSQRVSAGLHQGDPLSPTGGDGGSWALAQYVVVPR